jgi:uncharacterized protein involved in cysteine biosynthesis
MLKAAGRAIVQLLDPALFGVLLVSVIGAALVLLACWSGVGALLAHMTLFQAHWLDSVARVAAGVGAFLVTLALFGAVAAVIASLFIGQVARAVERRWYPALPPERRQGAGEQFAASLSFLAATIAVNALALPLYLLWGPNVLIFLGINGYLLGREYFELVALRRVDRRTAVRLRRTHAFQLLLAGMAIAALSFLPLANLVTPVLATAFMLHVFQGLPELNQRLPPSEIR